MLGFLRRQRELGNLDWWVSREVGVHMRLLGYSTPNSVVEDLNKLWRYGFLDRVSVSESMPRYAYRALTKKEINERHRKKLEELGVMK